MNFNGITHAIRSPNPFRGLILVGSVPIGPATHELKKATMADVMGGRTVTVNGEPWSYKQRSFPLWEDARTAVERDNGTMCDIADCACRTIEREDAAKLDQAIINAEHHG